MLRRINHFWKLARSIRLPLWQRIWLLGVSGIVRISTRFFSLDAVPWFRALLPFELTIPVYARNARFVLKTKNPTNLFAFRDETFCFDLYDQFSSTDRIIFDLGAEIGAFAIFGEKRTKERATIYAFEPEPNNLAELKKNLAYNSCRKVKIVPHAVSNKSGTARLYKGNPLTHSFYGTGKNTVKVATTTIDRFCKEQGIPHIDFLKMNIEGAELTALQGARHMLPKTKKILIGVHNFINPLLERDVCNLLLRSGFVLRSLPTPYPEHPWYLGVRR